MNKTRLVIENSAMAERWSALRPTLRWDKPKGRLWWDLVLQAEGNRLPIRIVYPPEYPARAPAIVVCTSLPNGTPHVLPPNELSDGFYRMCWHYPGEIKHNENIWCPGRMA